MAVSLKKLLANLPLKQNLLAHGAKSLNCQTSFSSSASNSPNIKSTLSESNIELTSRSTISSRLQPTILPLKPHHTLYISKNALSLQRCPSLPIQQLCHFSTSNALFMDRFNRKQTLKQHARTLDAGTRGELTLTRAHELPALELKLSENAAAAEDGEGKDKVRRNALDWMPRPEDFEHVYENGKKYRELPIIFLNAGKNNTKLGMTDARQNAKTYTSAGVEGFKGAKRGTNIAAQTAAMSFAKRLVRQSKVTHVRVVVKGLGPGRVSALEGMVMGGLKVVSITDDTPVFALDQGQGPGPRPRKPRRV